jgi:6-phosphogluconolactonase
MLLAKLLACFCLLMFALSFTTPVVGADQPGTAPKQLHVYVGTYGKANETGIAHFLFNPENGKMTEAKGATGVENPSFVAIHPNRRFLYAAAEVNAFGAHRPAN